MNQPQKGNVVVYKLLAYKVSSFNVSVMDPKKWSHKGLIIGMPPTCNSQIINKIIE